MKKNAEKKPTPKTVEDLMIPLDEYATVSTEATLEDAVFALIKAQKEFNANEHKHRAVLVLDKNKKVVGKVSQHDAMGALEINLEHIYENKHLISLFGKKAVEKMKEENLVWLGNLDDRIKAAANKKVTEFMYTPVEGEYIEKSANVEIAIHRLVTGRHRSLLVVDKPNSTRVVGVFREIDIYTLIANEIISL